MRVPSNCHPPHSPATHSTVIAPDPSNPESMNYGMLGDDDSGSEEKLAK